VLTSSLSAVLLLGNVSGSAGQTFDEFTEVIEVQVPVNVLSKSGEPIRGLTADDFEIFDGKSKQEITSFRVVDLDLVTFDDSQKRSGWVEGETDLPPSRSEVERAIPSEARRHFLLLFDMSFSTPAAIIRAREAAREVVLNSLHPTDLAGLATLTVESGPQLVLTFTPDRAQLARAIDTLGAPRLVRRSDPLAFVLYGPNFDPEFPNAPPPTTGSGSFAIQGTGGGLGIDDLTIVGQQISRQEKSFTRGRIFSWATQMNELAQMLNSVKGRKHIIYFSQGFDGTLLLGRKADSDDPEFQLDRLSIELGEYWNVDSNDIYGHVPLQNQVAQTLEAFRRSDATIQAVDISGLTAGGSAQERVRSVGRDTLFYIANDTGGEFFADANEMAEPLNQMLEHTSVTYLLGFQPEDLEADGSFHKIRVKVETEGGARIYHRKGYYAPRPFEDLHPFEKSLLAADAIASAAPRRDIGLSVLAAPFRADEHAAYVPVIIEVDGASLLAGQKDEFLSAEFYTYVTNERGEMKDFFTQAVGLDLSPGDRAFRRGGMKYYGHLELPEGEYLIRVLVRNTKTGMTGVESIPLSIPEYAEQQPVLLPPFFFDPDEAPWVLVKQREMDGVQRSVVYPFTVNGEPFIPSARPKLKKRQTAQLCLIGYNFGDGQLEVLGKIFDEEGQFVEGATISLDERTITGINEVDKLLATFSSERLAAGNYELRVAVRNRGSGSTQFSSIPISIVN